MVEMPHVWTSNVWAKLATIVARSSTGFRQGALCRAPGQFFELQKLGLLVVRLGSGGCPLPGEEQRAYEATAARAILFPGQRVL